MGQLSQMTRAQELRQSSVFLKLKTDLIAEVAKVSASLQGVQPAKEALKATYAQTLKQFTEDRGRDLYFPYLASGMGSGPFIELADGSVKYDMIAGIGVHFFGHSHPELMSAVVDGIASDVMHGNLQPGVEAAELSRAMLSRVGKESRLKHCWLTTCGTMANENALKMIRQKKFPATRIFAFEDCFAGRSSAMAEITDNPSYRDGLPTYGEVSYLPFFKKSESVEKNLKAVLERIDYQVSRYPGKYAALMLELAQGEGGFNYASPEYYSALFEACKARGLAIWIDEIQTFGRTGELFAYQTFGVEKYVDILTVAKLLQASLLLYTNEYNPRPGLVAGTFTGSASALLAGKRVLELLDEKKMLGKQGKIMQLSKLFYEELEKLKQGRCKNKIGDIRVLGGMVGFVPFDGSMKATKETLLALFEAGVIAFYCGHGPHLVRMLPPLGAMNEAQVKEVCKLIGDVLEAMPATDKKGSA